ncbi:TPA: hypothetical protein ACSPZ6_004493, partial [Aeromonas hydrophila]
NQVVRGSNPLGRTIQKTASTLVGAVFLYGISPEGLTRLSSRYLPVWLDSRHPSRPQANNSVTKAAMPA